MRRSAARALATAGLAAGLLLVGCSSADRAGTFADVVGVADPTTVAPTTTAAPTTTVAPTTTTPVLSITCPNGAPTVRNAPSNVTTAVMTARIGEYGQATTLRVVGGSATWSVSFSSVGVRVTLKDAAGATVSSAITYC